MHRPVGLDINGWRDYGSRDWSAEDPDAPAGAPVTLDGGSHSVIVQHDDLLVGGPQAIVSPIGRGQGWSDIGEASKRRSLAEHWSALLAGTTGQGFDGDIRSAARALSLLADQRVVCIPDHAGMGEAQQKRLLAALSGPREPRPMLLWRSVAVALGLLEGGGLPDAAEGMRIACLIHGADGIEQQVLILRRLAEHQGQLAPERAGPGDVCCRMLGLVRLLSRAAEAVDATNPVLRHTRTDTPRMAVELLFREAPLYDEEIVRRINSNWLMLRTPRDFVLSDLAEAVAGVSVEADRIVLLSPLAARHRDRLAEWLAASKAGQSVIVANPDTAARGALFAARRIERGIPHYLDHLDQISLIAMRGDAPVFEDLIPTNAKVPGNREYIAPPITSLIWTAGMAEVQFYIRKGPREVRRWVTQTQAPPERNERLEVHLRQMPAQGWATLSVTAADWEPLRRAPIFLDWSSLEVDPRSEADIFATLQRPRPAVPQRVHYEAHIGLWNGSLRQPGLRHVLMQFRPGDTDGLSNLAAMASASYRRSARHPDGPLGPVYPVGTDGELPNELDAATRERFFCVVGRVSDDLLRAISRPAGTLQSNDALRFLTWIFAACPQEVQGAVSAAFESVLAGKGHRLLDPVRARTVVIHGLGRVITDKRQIRRLIPLLCGQLPNTTFLAPLASLLSRPVATPEALADLDVETIAKTLRPVLRTQYMARTFGTGYKYSLLVLGGLLRVREHDPWALTSERSGAAKGLADELRNAAENLRRLGSAGLRGGPEKYATTLTLIDYLETNEGRPDILSVIDGIDE